MSNDNWIPVEEKIPEEGYWLVTLDNGLVVSAYYTNPGYWYTDGAYDSLLSGVIAWQPLPAPYVKPRRFEAVPDVLADGTRSNAVIMKGYPQVNAELVVSTRIPTREAAEKIADIYEEAYRGE